MSMDAAESFLNAVFGLAISAGAVVALRAVGAWETASPLTIAGLFFALSWGRSRALRAWFRGRE